MKSFKQFLLEMPLGYFDASQIDDDQNRSVNKINKKDVAIVRHRSTENKLREVLGRINIDFIILISNINTKEKDIINYLTEKNINFSNSIVFVKKISTGGKLTPWMLLHCIGHAAKFDFIEFSRGVRNTALKMLSLIAGFNIDNHIFADDSFTDFFRIISNISLGSKSDELRNYSIQSHYGDAMDLYHRDLARYEHLSNIFQFSSIKTKKVDSFEEFICELVAEFLWHGGKIRYNQQYILDSFSEHIANGIVRVIKKIEEILIHKMNSLKGQIIID